VGVTDRIRARALELGFDAVGVAAVAGDTPDAERFADWLAAGRHGAMDWLATDRNRARRADPARILPGVRSIVCVLLCHEPDADPARDARLGRIARYAVGEDYHRIMRERLSRLEREIMAILPGSRALWYADTGAILERGWAQRAGLGWNGRHSGFLSPSLGSWLLLGEVLVDRELEADAPFASDHCGGCTRCLEACPTRAIVAPGEVDARLCLSYLTIEDRGSVPAALRPLLGDWIFGCDACQEVCPWNRFAPATREPRLRARALEGWTLAGFLALDEAGFQTLFADSALRRATRGGFLRNVCIALGNRGNTAALPDLRRAAAEDPDPLVREHATWAIEEIARRSGASDAC
jgi:epoxyqueuosine reductase